GQKLCRPDAALLADARIGRHERGIEGALPEDRAEMVGQPQRDKECVGNRAGTEHGSQRDVADEAGQAREQRESADREDASDHRLTDRSPHGAKRNAGNSWRRWSRMSLRSIRATLAALSRQPPSARRTVSTIRSWVGSSRWACIGRLTTSSQSRSLTGSPPSATGKPR